MIAPAAITRLDIEADLFAKYSGRYDAMPEADQCILASHLSSRAMEAPNLHALAAFIGWVLGRWGEALVDDIAGEDLPVWGEEPGGTDALLSWDDARVLRLEDGRVALRTRRAPFAGNRQFETDVGNLSTPALERELADLAPPGALVSDWRQTWADEGFRLEDALGWARAGVLDAGRAREIEVAGLTPTDMSRRCVCRAGLVRECATRLDLDAQDVAQLAAMIHHHNEDRP